MLISEFANVHLHFPSFLACGRKLWKETVCTNSMVLLTGVLLIPQRLEVNMKLYIGKPHLIFLRGKKAV